jgi:hypothetical protein
MLAGAAISMSGAAAVAESDAWSSSNTDEVRALVAEMLADAESRSSLLQGGGSAGHDGKFFLASADGNFRLNVGGQLQFRWNADFRDVDNSDDWDGDGDGNSDFENEDDSDWGFEMRRAKLEFSGVVFDQFDYKIVGSFDDNGGQAELEDAWVGWDLGESGWHLALGQFKAPVLREELVSSKYQLAVDRSLTNEVFSANRSQGLWLHHEQENWRLDVSINDGVDGVGIPPYSGANVSSYNDESDFAATARFEFMWTGEWDQFKDFTSAPGSANAGMIGAAAHYQLGRDYNTDVNAPDLLIYTVDVSWESDGWNLFGAFMGNSVDYDDSAQDDQDQFGFVVQGGWYLNENTELFARYDYVDFDLPSGVPGDSDQSTITLGFNHYMHGQAAKFSFDFNWALNESFATGQDPESDQYTGIFGMSGIGYQGSTDSDEIYLRAQFQLLF